MASNAEIIWNFLRANLGMTPAGAAGMMGNLDAESGLNPRNLQNAYQTSTRTDDTYTASVDNKTYSRSSFEGDAFGYGLAQWTHYSLKGPLYDKTVGEGKSVGDLYAQLLFIQWELNNFEHMPRTVYPVLKTSNDVNECSDLVLTQFEKPANQSDSVKRYRRERSQYYYSTYSALPVKQIKNGSTVVSNYDARRESNASKLVNFALNEVKTHEGNGYNYYVKQLGAPNEAWCAWFCVYCCNKCGIPIYQSYGVKSLWSYYNNKGLTVDKNNILPGDIIVFRSNKYQFQHVGIVVESHASEGYYITVEGNTSSSGAINPVKQSTGNALHKKKRTINNNYMWVLCGLRIIGDNDGSVTYDDYENYGLPSGPAYESVLSEDEVGIIQKLFSGQRKPVDKGGATTEKYVIEYETKTAELRYDEVVSTDADPNSIRAKGTSLLTTPSRVESPFIILNVGGYTFGSYERKGEFNLNSSVKVSYPNYITSIDIVKTNGMVNQYTIQMIYQIEAGNDPNLLDKIFSRVGYGTVTISYGDWSSPTFIYKNEEAMITNLRSNVDFAHSQITYTLKCTSTSLSLLGGYYNFPATTSKPSDILTNMLYSQNATYKLLDAFPGMKNEFLVRSKGLLRTDDREVRIEAKTGLDPLSYINYLVSCMSSNGDDNDSSLRGANYVMTICDDTTGEFGGAYFKISKIEADTNTIAVDSSDTYEVDIGYPSESTLVTKFSINNDNSWALLYNYSQDIVKDNYTYDIDNNGNIVTVNSPNVLLSSKYGRTTETQKNWWTQMTQFPIKATLEIKGLLRPAMLMSYIRVNAFFYGQRHVSSGLYVVTKQNDRIDGNGYRTTLSLTRVAGDLDTIKTSSKTVSYKIPINSVKQ